MRRFELLNPDVEWEELYKSLLKMETIAIDGVEYYVTQLRFSMFSNDVTAEFTEKS